VQEAAARAGKVFFALSVLMSVALVLVLELAQWELISNLPFRYLALA
jgi:hypothetical protein